MPTNLNLNHVYTKVAQHADTESLQLSVADTSRVIATFFSVCNEMEPAEMAATFAKGLRKANDKMVKPAGRAGSAMQRQPRTRRLIPKR